MHLQEIGELQALKTHVSRRNDLKSYLFFIVTSGSGTLTYDGSEYPLQTGDCVFIDCMKPYAHETSEDLWSLKWIHFYGPMMPQIYKKYIERGGTPCFRPAQLSGFEVNWAELFERASSADYIRDMRINEGLNTILTLLMEESWHSDQETISPKRRDLKTIQDYLQEHYAERITLDDLSERFFINKFYLTRIFKAQYGVSINQYLSQLRITHAKQALRFTDETVESIGYRCGLGEPSYFSRVFKQVEGVSPSEFRRKWQN